LVVRFPWKRYRLRQYLVVGLGVGFPYTMLSFYGLKVIHAAHAGVLVNGMLPMLGAVAAWLFFQQRIARHRRRAIGLIGVANLLMSGGFSLAADQLIGIGLLLTAAVCYTFHMTGIRLWQMSWQDVLVIVPVVNVLLFTPLWLLFPSGMSMATYHDMALQAVYQGVIVNVIALMCVAYAIRNLGTLPVALFMSFVPVATALLAWIALGEVLSGWEMCGIIGCSVGLLWYAWEPSDRTASAVDEK
jgi:drug/metabolite transporter (DMT)-like permease